MNNQNKKSPQFLRPLKITRIPFKYTFVNQFMRPFNFFVVSVGNVF